MGKADSRGIWKPSQWKWCSRWLWRVSECVTGRECTPGPQAKPTGTGGHWGRSWAVRSPEGSVCGNWWEECDRRLGQTWRLFSRVEVPSLSWSHSQLSQVLTGFCLCAGKIILGNMKSTERRKPEENETTEWIVETGGRWWDSKVGCWQWVEVGRLNLRHLRAEWKQPGDNFENDALNLQSTLWVY